MMTQSENTELAHLAQADNHLAQVAQTNPAAVYLASLRPSGRRTQAQALNVIAKFLGTAPAFQTKNTIGKDGKEYTHDEDTTWLFCAWSQIKYAHSAAIRAHLAEHYSPAAANKMLCALRGTLKAAWNADQISGEDYHKAASVEGITGSSLPPGRSLSGGELAALMNGCAADHTPAGARDAAILVCLYIGGLRRSELCSLQMDDYSADSLAIRGKRGKERRVFLNGASAALEDWITLRGADPGHLFQPINKGGKIGAGGLTPEALYGMLQRRAADAGVANFSPHDLRRTCAGDLLDAGVDVVTVSKILGHSSTDTTKAYDRRPETAQRKAAGLLHLPYRRRMI